MHKYGVLIGRFQPLHLGHMAIISEIIADGLRPVIFIGSSESEKTDKNPYSFLEREVMIGEVYGELIDCYRLPDNPDNKIWAKYLEELLGDRSVLYYHRKKSDCNSQWGGGHYVDLLSDKIKIKESKYATKIDLPICATDIRGDLEGNKHYLDGRVYSLLKKIKVI